MIGTRDLRRFSPRWASFIVFLATTSHASRSAAHTVYLNFSDGQETVVRGDVDDASLNQSSLCEAAPYLSWTGAEGCGDRDTCRAEILELVRESWRPFAVDFTLTRPTNDFTLVMVGPASGTCAFGLLGISRVDCDDRVARDVAFAFDCAGSTTLCARLVSHELGHAFGLDHTMERSDLMYGGIVEGSATFHDYPEPLAPSAQCASGTQSAVSYLLQHLGPAQAESSADPACAFRAPIRGQPVSGLVSAWLSLAVFVRRRGRRGRPAVHRLPNAVYCLPVADAQHLSLQITPSEPKRSL